MKTMTEATADKWAFWALIALLAGIALEGYWLGHNHKMQEITQAERLAVYCRTPGHMETLCVR